MLNSNPTHSCSRKTCRCSALKCGDRSIPIRKPNDWDWVDHWDSTNSLPALMRIGLGLGKTGKRGDVQDLVVKVVALPARAVQPVWQMPGGVPGQPAIQ